MLESQQHQAAAFRTVYARYTIMEAQSDTYFPCLSMISYMFLNCYACFYLCFMISALCCMIRYDLMCFCMNLYNFLYDFV